MDNDESNPAVINKPLLSAKELGLGRDLALAIVKRLPHLAVGRAGQHPKLMVRREDYARLLNKAARERADLWELVRRYLDLTVWLDAPDADSRAGEVVSQ